jgi:drug/metabolite transporter (DMT)-like permease
MQRTFGIVLMFLAACSYGAAGILIKLAYRAGLQPAALLPMQNLVAIAFMWPMLLVLQGKPKIGLCQLRRLIWQGLAGNFAISVCYFWAAQRIDVSLLSIILFTYPALVLAYQIGVEKRRAAPAELVALLLAVCGAVLSVDLFHGTAAAIDRLGLILAVGAAFSYAFMNIHGQKLTEDVSSQVIATMTSTVSTVALLALFPRQSWSSFAFPRTDWIFILSLAILSTVVPMNLMYLAIRRIGAFHASVVSVAELPCILVLAYFILSERMNSWQMLGGGMILLSLILTQQSQSSIDSKSAPDVS